MERRRELGNRWCKFLVFVTFSIFALPLTLFGGMGWTVTPVKVEKTITGFKEITEVFEVYNVSDDSLRIKIELEDFVIDEYGKVRFLPRESLPNSISHWTVVNPEELLLMPQVKELVRMTFHIPDSLEFAEYYGMLVFKSLPIPTLSAPYHPTIQVAGEIGVPIYYTMGSQGIREGYFESLYVKKDTVYIIFRNTGNVHLRVTGEAKILNTNEKVVEYDKIPEFLVLPNRSRRVRLPIDKKLESGEYILRVCLDYGAVELLEGERIFKVGR